MSRPSTTTDRSDHREPAPGRRHVYVPGMMLRISNVPSARPEPLAGTFVEPVTSTSLKPIPVKSLGVPAVPPSNPIRPDIRKPGCRFNARSGTSASPSDEIRERPIHTSQRVGLRRARRRSARGQRRRRHDRRHRCRTSRDPVPAWQESRELEIPRGVWRPRVGRRDPRWRGSLQTQTRDGHLRVRRQRAGPNRHMTADRHRPHELETDVDPGALFAVLERDRRRLIGIGCAGVVDRRVAVRRGRRRRLGTRLRGPRSGAGVWPPASRQPDDRRCSLARISSISASENCVSCVTARSSRRR